MKTALEDNSTPDTALVCVRFVVSLFWKKVGGKRLLLADRQIVQQHRRG